MSKQLVKKFKWWWVWQDGMHERWLQEQARQGLHLHASDPLGIRMTFERGAPADMAYRWDFPGVKADPVYTQLFIDGGWERVVDVAGWRCWRKPVVDGKIPEIFTDVPSKVRKYQRNLVFLLVCGLPLLMVVVAPASRHALLAEPRVATVAGASLLMLAYAVGKLVQRVRQLRQGAAQ
ncbi:DUF2812 domain-containing protein [Janthinobacterium svalbardensis]|uniref:DUF2812 domain-containing protein n=1 Tax=Janthinobacterium svalbardensis TaxID=368607 RepID=UPI002FCD97E8